MDYGWINFRLESGRHDGDWSGYRVRVNGEYDVDLPTPINNLNNYCATLAHKSNHAFGEDANAKWTRLDHPRFGMISALSAKRNICKGEEILVDYGLDMAEAPEWYKTLFVDHCRKAKNMSDEEILDWCRRQHRIKGKWCQLPIFDDA